jgi:hypothetical protein
MSAYNSGPQTNFRECCMVSRQSVTNIDDRTIPWPSTLSAFPRLKPPSAGFVPSTNAKCQTKFEGTVTYSHFFVSLGSLTISFLGYQTNPSCCWVGPQFGRHMGFVWKLPNPVVYHCFQLKKWPLHGFVWKYGTPKSIA